MLKILKSPSPTQYTLQLRWLLSIGIPLFVFVFLAVFRPFELYEKVSIHPIAASVCFAFITFIYVFIMLFGWLKYLSNRLGDKWTIGYELCATLLTVTCIGITNHLIMKFIVSPEIYLSHSASNAFFLSMRMTYSVAALPVALLLFISVNQLNLRKKTLHSNKNGFQEENPSESINMIVENGQSKENSIELNSDTFLYAKAAGNYVEFYSKENGIIQKDMQRITLAKLETIFLKKAFPTLKTHRGYIINTKKVLSYEGNSQGYLLNFGDKLEKVPVSRKQITDFDRVMNR
ncbi:MAG: LytTR family transcriptional regulator [Crocinitomicaceae bacterium]|nr:LytTR family transcriptional regulator [Flavobacteriales bacterium]NQZ36250.1 LytTR family transcriptional regulator [Crocinitomicaceae bacterium]